MAVIKFKTPALNRSFSVLVKDYLIISFFVWRISFDVILKAYIPFASPFKSRFNSLMGSGIFISMIIFPFMSIMLMAVEFKMLPSFIFRLSDAGFGEISKSGLGLSIVLTKTPLLQILAPQI